MAWFKKEADGRVAIPKGLWIKCNACSQMLYKKEVERNFSVCPKCNYHFRISARERIDTQVKLWTWALVPVVALLSIASALLIPARPGIGWWHQCARSDDFSNKSRFNGVIESTCGEPGRHRRVCDQELRIVSRWGQSM